ncbi:MAG: molybdopterin-dependent oxidoreductase, partial [Chloroflexi bacterium]|nr:molybdopterin-dependent oxidoreductase [Chloroflexota bacterium]
MEPQASTAWVDPSGHVTVWTSIQGVHWAKADLSAILQVPHSKLRVVPLEIGGGFGGK